MRGVKVKENLPRVLLVTCLSLLELGYFPQFRNIGFYCNDPKISFKYNGDTVSSYTLFMVSFLYPFIVMITVERLMYSKDKCYKYVNRKRPWLRITNSLYLKYALGLCSVFFITDVTKIIIGEPRPHFLDTCRPLQANNCTAGNYFSEYTCTNKVSQKQERDAVMSFPSGHASFSSYAALFVMWFLQKRLVTPSHILLRFLQLICLSWAIFVCLSRITDRRHHWWDVLAGSILGASISIYSLYLINYNQYEKKDKLEESSSTNGHSDTKTTSYNSNATTESFIQTKSKIINS